MATGAAAEKGPGQRLVVAAVFVTGGFVTVMDGTIVNVALPAIGRSLHARPTAVGGVAIAYLIAMAASVPVSGWLASRLGMKRVLLGALVLFTCASALCGLCSSLTELLLMRVLQGAGGGLIAPVGLALLYRTFPPEDRMRVSSLTMIPTLIAPATGPVLGGLLVTEISWRAVFYVNVPIGVAGALFGLRHLVEPGDEQRHGRFDVLGFAAATFALGLLTFGLSEGSTLGWGRPLILATFGGGLALLAAAVAIELRIAHPLLVLRIFANRAFRAGSGVVALTGGAFVAMLLGVSLYFQYGRGLTPLSSGLSSFPEAVGVIVGVQLAMRWLYRRVGPAAVVAGGASSAGVAITALALMGAGTSLWWARLILFLVGISVGTVFSSVQLAAFYTVEPELTNAASTLYTVVRQVSGAVGVAVLTTVVAIIGATRRTAATTAVEHANLAAYRWPFVVLGAVACCGALVAWRGFSGADGAPGADVRRAATA